jgi:hypothetical protein
MTDRTRRTGLDDGRVPANQDHRRQAVRFEVLGRMAGSVASMETLQLVNLGTNGALVESALPLPPNAEFKMQLVLDGHVSEATVKIRRVNEIRRENGALRYRIGLEFLALSAEAEEAIHQFVNVNQAQI